MRQLFEETPSKMVRNGIILRDAIDAIDPIDFHQPESVHTLSHLYESLLAKMGREGGMSGEFYTPRPIIEFMVEMIDPRIGEKVYDPAMGSGGFLVEAYRHMERQVCTTGDRQRSIIAKLRELQDKTAQLRKMQEESASTLAAMQPAVLDKALRGEL